MEEDRQYGYDSPGSGIGTEPAEENYFAGEGGQTYCSEAQSGGAWQEEGFQGQYRQMEYQGYTKPMRQSNMALASLVMGILGIVMSCCCYGGLIFGCLGIMFALLSKMGDTMEGYAKAGLITSVIALFMAAMSLIFLWGMMSSLLMGGVYG